MVYKWVRCINCNRIILDIDGMCICGSMNTIRINKEETEEHVLMLVRSGKKLTFKPEDYLSKKTIKDHMT